jgi:hypothetical protein
MKGMVMSKQQTNKAGLLPMSNDAGTRPMAEILHSLNEHVKNADSGVFFIYGEGVAGWVHLNQGRYEDVAMQNRHSDEAVALLMNVRAASCNFRPGKVFPGHHPPLSETAKGLLRGGANMPPVLSMSQRPAASASVSLVPRQGVAPAAPFTPAKVSPQTKTHQMQEVEKLTLAYLGPMASIICQEAWEDHGAAPAAVQAIAENLSGNAKAAFLADVRKIIGY